jgi:hypothetical protein
MANSADIHLLPAMNTFLANRCETPFAVPQTSFSLFQININNNTLL